ncbi:MAG: ParB/RepB/Spo0J family partition protein [Moraxella sp.]|nr:ParB/RepB/Spo0J family partition protein [Moraxella sp.]
MTKKRGLGSNRGLDVLMGNIKKEREITASALQETADGTPLPADDKNEQVALVQMSVDRLQSGKYQPRRAMNEVALNELASSIKQHGVMQPIVIRPLLDGENKTADGVTHEIIAGERRWRAAKLAGLASIPAIERVLSDELAIALALIENIQREDLNVLEQAQALQRFHTEFGMSHGMIADVVGKARTTVSNLLRLNQLHPDVKACMQAGQLDMGHARPLLSLSSEQQPIIAKKIIDGQMTVRDAEKLVKSILNPDSPKPVQVNSHEIVALNQQLSDALGATVKLKQGKDGKGSVEIFFYSDDELAEIINQLKSAQA